MYGEGRDLAACDRRIPATARYGPDASGDASLPAFSMASHDGVGRVVRTKPRRLPYTVALIWERLCDKI